MANQRPPDLVTMILGFLRIFSAIDSANSPTAALSFVSLS
nr:MAG TPA: hypothetical protein [Caudoviricetes sp.]